MRFFRTLLCLIVLMFFAVPALAQPKNTSLFTLEDGYHFTLPTGWVQADWDGEGFLLENSDASILVLDPVLMESLVSLSSRSDVGEALISAYDSFYGDTLDDSDLEFITYGEYTAAQWFFEDQDDNEGVFITAEIARRTFIAFDIVAPAGERDDAIDAAKAMLATLTQDEAATSTASGSTGTLTSSTSSTTTTVSTSSEPCTISVSSANTAALRVGPGTNRTSVAFLPAGVDFEVIGQATADDGSEWFKLDKAEAAPRSAANEIWVAADDVETAGDCAAVVDAAAPPVVPIINNPPPATPAPAGSGETTTTTTTSGGTAPQSGGWTLSFARQTNGSCQGTGNFVIPTGDAWSSWSEADYSFGGQLFASGGNIVFAGDTYRPTGTPNQYVASFDLGGGYNNQIYITFNSPTTFVGQMTGNATFDGFACSVSTPLSGRRG
jgi:hypothetical protein